MFLRNNLLELQLQLMVLDQLWHLVRYRRIRLNTNVFSFTFVGLSIFAAWQPPQNVPVRPIIGCRPCTCSHRRRCSIGDDHAYSFEHWRHIRHRRHCRHRRWGRWQQQCPDPPEVAGTTSKQVTTSVISSAAKLSLCAYFEGDKWPLSKALPRGNEFLSGLLRKIVRLYSLIKIQVAC